MSLSEDRKYGYDPSKYKPITQMREYNNLSSTKWDNVFGSSKGSRVLYKVPIDQTSDIPIKRTFYKFKTPTNVMKFVLYCMDNYHPEMSLNDIRRAINKQFGMKVTAKTMSTWKKRFRPQLVYPLHRKHTKEWNESIRNGLKKYFREQDGSKVNE